MERDLSSVIPYMGEGFECCMCVERRPFGFLWNRFGLCVSFRTALRMRSSHIFVRDPVGRLPFVRFGIGILFVWSFLPRYFCL